MDLRGEEVRTCLRVAIVELGAVGDVLDRGLVEGPPPRVGAEGDDAELVYRAESIGRGNAE